MSLDTNMSDEEFEAVYQAELDKLDENEGQSTDEEEIPQEAAEEIVADGNEDEGSEDPEQPDADNSDEAAEEDSDQNEQVEGETEEDEDSEDSKDEGEIDTPETEEQSEEDAETDVKADAPTQYVIKAHGKEIVADSIDELKILASKGLDYTKKMQRFAKHKEHISALEEANLGMNDLNLMIDVLKGGDKNAVSSLLKRINVDVDELALEDGKEVDYTPKSYGRSATELDIDEVVSNISGDPEYRTTEHVLTSRLDADSKKYFADNPDQIYVLHDDVKAGRFNEISAAADKLMQLETGRPRPFVDYYIQAGNAKLQQQHQQEALMAKAKADAQAKQQAQVEAAKTKKAKQAKVKAEDAKRKAAGITKSKTTAKSAPKDYLDEDMSDEEFLKLYESKIN